MIGKVGISTASISFRVSAFSWGCLLAVSSPEALRRYGYTCNFEKGNYVYAFLVACLTFGGMGGAYMPPLIIDGLLPDQSRPSTVIMTLGMITVVVLYRSQKGSLITVIRRDGGIYMILTYSKQSNVRDTADRS